ncbi:MAG: heparin lyase I family protein [Acidobacteriota bacterium]
MALALFGCGLWWGLPGPWGWAGDELHPSSWRQAIATDPPVDSRAWHLRYPPLHFAVLEGVSWPLRALIDHGAWNFSQEQRDSSLIVLGRFVSLAMALGIVWLVYLVGCEIYDRRSAQFAALIAVSIAPLVYYAKMGNLDAPYVFWFVLSLLFYVRILKQHQLRDYVLFAAAAAAAVCTKDQAYGLYTLAPIPILASLYRREHRDSGVVRGIARSLVDRRVLFAALTAAAGFTVLQELVLNPERFRLHVQLLLGPMSKDYEDYSDTPVGHLGLLALFLKQTVFVLDPLLAVICALGIGLTGWRLIKRSAGEPEVLLGCLFALLVSYYVTFLNLILFSYDRYLLPVAVLLAFFGGRALGVFTREGSRWPRWRQAAVATGFTYAILYAASVDARLLADSRYYVEDWVKAHAPKPISAAAVGRKKHIPRFEWIPWEKVKRTHGGIIGRRGRPQFLAVNVTDLRSEHEVDFYHRLGTGELGYRLVLLHRGHPLFDLITTDESGSSQRFINPEMALFERVDGPSQPASAASEPLAVLTGEPAIPARQGAWFCSDFETGDLRGWRGDLARPESAAVVTEPVRKGRYAVRINLGPGDRAASKERAELKLEEKDVERVHGRQGSEMWYGWSLLVPADYSDPPRGQFQILAQWHQQLSDIAGPFKAGAPPVALHLVNDERGGHKLILAGRSVPYGDPRTLGPEPIRLGSWVDLVVHIRWSTGNDGLVEAWLDGRPFGVGKMTGATLYTPVSNYLRLGLYRSKGVLSTNHIFLDEVRVGDSYAAVAP